MKQAIDIPMRIGLASFWENLLLYSYEKEYVSSLISSDKIQARHFHSKKRFIVDLCAIYNGGEFGPSFCEI